MDAGLAVAVVDIHPLTDGTDVVVACEPDTAADYDAYLASYSSRCGCDA